MADDRSADRCWQFHCPECGFGDAEVGEMRHAEEIFCEVCLSEDGRLVRVRRWLAAAEPPRPP